ncbi:MAG: N-acetylmuramoyl-L-alanine amidase, partial [Candidatus Latescibacteria bacterium]|nr:N-acetylmuramoyl-L-alanine amidase [Candidatus Latescibacterota bacterium]
MSTICLAIMVWIPFVPTMLYAKLPTAQALYDEANAYYRQITTGGGKRDERTWNAAADRFRRVVERYPNDQLADDDQYAIGLCYLRDSNYEMAMKEFGRLTKHYRESDLADDAQYLVGYAAQKSGRIDQAIEAYLAVFRNSPGGDMVEKAVMKVLDLYQARRDVEGVKKLCGEVQTAHLAPWVLSRCSQSIEQVSAPAETTVVGAANLSMKERISGAPTIAPGLTAIQRIRTSSSGRSTRVVIDLEKGIDYQVGRLEDPPRLYVDLKGAVLHPPKPDPIPVGDGIVKQIRAAQLSSNATRVVLDLDQMMRYHVFRLTNPDRIVADVLADQAQSSLSLARELGLKVRTIVIDPGHGGKDPGATGFGIQEKDIVLDVGKRLKAILDHDPSYEVYLTREEDVFIPLEARTAFANQKEADLFLSIHVNSSPSLSKGGIETYYLSMPSDREARLVAAFENAMAEVRMADLEDMVKKILKGTHLTESRRLAGMVQT